MMSDILKIVKWPDSILLGPTRKIQRVDSSITELAHNMLATMYAAPGVGLAANQVGEPIRLLVIDETMPNQQRNPIVMINPEIVHFEGAEIMEEGCLSIPGFRADVERSSFVVVRGFGLDEKPIEIEADELLARAFQHEIDHLNGKLFPDRLSRLKKNLVFHKVRKAIKNGTFGTLPNNKE